MMGGPCQDCVRKMDTSLAAVRNEDEKDSQECDDTANTRALKEGNEALTVASAMVSQVHLAFPMGQWVVDLQERLATSMRSFSEIGTSIKFRVAMEAATSKLEKKDKLDDDSFASLNGYLSQHTSQQSFKDEKTQESMCMLIQAMSTFDSDRHKLGEVCALGLQLEKFVLEEYKAKMGGRGNAVAMLTTIEKFATLRAEVGSIDTENFVVLKKKWADVFGSMHRADEKLESTLKEHGPAIQLEEDIAV